MPATSIFISAESSGIPGIGTSRISVLLAAVRTAARTFSLILPVSHGTRTRQRCEPGQGVDARPLRRRDRARDRAGERGARLSAAAHGGRVLDSGTRALPFQGVQAAGRSQRNGHPAAVVQGRTARNTWIRLRLLLNERRARAMSVAAKTRPQVATMNAVHDLPVLVARDKGFFKAEGLDIEFVTTPGMAQSTTWHFVNFDSVFDRPLDSVYNEGGIDQYRMCEWGIMKRAVEANAQGLRARRIVALGASMSKFAIVVRPDSKIYEPEMLKDKPIAVTPNNGSDFTTLKMIEGFLEPQNVKRTNAGSMLKRLEAVRCTQVAAASLMEPWISVAQKWGLRILIESHSTRAEAAGDDLDGATLKKMFRAQARAVELIEKDPTPFVHYFIRETGGLLNPQEFQTWRLLPPPPQPYTRERYDDTYNWTVKWDMTVAGATYENTVDNRAWK